MTEPCPVCPPFVVRCGHLGDVVISVWYTLGPAGDDFNVEWWNEREKRGIVSRRFVTRAEADAEFDRREEALLA